MDCRTALKPQTKLYFYDKEGGKILYTIVREIGRGSSCIVYEASHKTTTDDRKLYRIKECYPYKLQIRREDSGRLIPNIEDKKLFENLQGKMRADFKTANSLFYSEGVMGMFTDQMDTYCCNGTTYIVSAFSAEKTLATYKPVSIKECVMLVKQVAYVIEKIHQQGFLYLDTKPNNILIVEGLESRIQLFDFDSLISIQEITNKKDLKCSDLRLSYSKGFAPVELQTARIKHIGTHTDVFGVGALLFYLLFGCTPTAMDCESDAIYPFEKMGYDSKKCDDKLFGELADFFHNALANYYLDRYQSMQQVFDKLCEIEPLADIMIPRIFSTILPTTTYIIGRDAEFRQIDEFIDDTEQRCMFVTGMGGIGKSTLVRGYIQSRRHKFDTVLYMQFDGTMETTIVNDMNIEINTLKYSETEKSNIRYFDKKIQKIRELVRNKAALIVIDNFGGEIDKDTLEILKIGCKVILVSRQAPAYRDGLELPIESITDKSILRKIFEKHLGNSISTKEQSLFENIVNRVNGHTLVLELIAKQIGSSHITLSEAASLVDEHGFSDMASEKVNYEKDGQARRDTIGNIIDALFEASKLSTEKRLLLKIFSLIGVEGIDINLYRKILQVKSMDAINEMVTDGWLMLNKDILSMHPVIQEAIYRWEWTEEWLDAAEALLTYFYIEINLEATKNNYPKKLYDLLTKGERMISDDARNSVMYQKMVVWRDNILEKQFQKGGIVGKVNRERYLRINDNAPADKKKLEYYVLQAEKILGQCKRENTIKQLEIYVNLLYITVLYMPSYREDYILSQTKKIFSENMDDFVLERTTELLQRNESRNPITIMRLYRNTALIHAEKRNTDALEKVISKAWKLARWAKHSQVYAIYYDLLSEYYDIMLDGAYDAETPKEKEYLQELLSAIDKALKYSKKHMTRDVEHLYAKNILAKATILMRSGYGKSDEIRKLIGLAQRVIEDNTLPYADVRHQYYMVCGWYYAFISEDVEATDAVIYLAKELSLKIATTDLDVIDKTLVPCANIYLELQCYEKSMKLLNDGIKICLEYEALEVYNRKCKELCEYLHDVVNMTDYPKRYKMLIDLIASDAEDVQSKKNFSLALEVLCFNTENFD